MPAQTRKQTPHLFAGFIALGLAAIALFAAERVLVHLEHTTIVSTAPEVFLLKNQGLAFQRAAARAPNVFPIYGSSELLVPAVPEKGNNFFRTAPTGFQFSPVGDGGAVPLNMLQRVGALGANLRGKKLAISLSPSWFFAPTPSWEGYKGNFSPMAAIEMVFCAALDFELKRDIASRMLECPSILDKRPLLEFALRRLASGSWVDRIVWWVLWPAGKAQIGLLELQDHVAALCYIQHDVKVAPQLHAETVDWSKLIARVETIKSSDWPAIPNAPGVNVHITPGSRDAAFRSGISASPRWIDLELLLRTLSRIHAQPLILSMPIAGYFYNEAGVSQAAREIYYAKLRAIVQRYHFELVEFESHEEDPSFLLRHESHLTAKGWVYYDRALDDFFHGRPPRG
jgi:D-alanine transfer protein